MAENNKKFNSLEKSENLHTNQDLKDMQSRTFGDKVQTSVAKIMEAMIRYDKKMYVSFSGGKDSTVLADLVAQVCQMWDCKLTLWFSDTGLEFPELREHVKTYGEYLRKKYDIEVEVIMDYPTDRKGKRITFREVVLEKGYPIISKDVSDTIHDARLGQKSKLDKLNGNCVDKNGNKSMFNCSNWKFLLDAPFKISEQCCDIMKKRPAHKFGKKSGLTPFIGTMAVESRYRKNQWLKNGCNSFNGKNPSSRPMSFWTEQDIFEYIVRYELPYPSVYGEIKKDENGKWYTTGYSRTGCMFCAYGCHLEKEPNRFQMLKETHPKIWEYCMKPVEDGGLGMKEVLEYIHVDTE